MTRGRGGFKSPKKFADVICEWPLMGKKRAAEMRSDSAEFFPSHFSCFRPNGSVWFIQFIVFGNASSARLLSLGAKKKGLAPRRGWDGIRRPKRVNEAVLRRALLKIKGPRPVGDGSHKFFSCEKILLI